MHRQQAQPEGFGLVAEHWRDIAGFDGYVVNAEGVVWSVGRTVQTKGGATRTTAARPLKPDEKNRVALRRDGKTYKVNVDELAVQHFPPKRHYAVERSVQLTCRHCGRGYRDFAVWWCEGSPVVWPDRYICPHCWNSRRWLADLQDPWGPPLPKRPRPRPRDWSDVALPDYHFPTHPC
jgi:hypothetical protein